MEDHTRTWSYSCPWAVGRWGLKSVIPHSPQFSLTSMSKLITVKIHLSTKRLYGPYWTMSPLWGSREGPYRAQSLPTDSSRPLIERIHLIWPHEERRITADQICRTLGVKGRYFIEAAIRTNKKEQWMQGRQMQLEVRWEKKKKI